MEKAASKEPRYNLAYVIQETGIKADTLRAWERRYDLPQPRRTEGGHRLFSEFDIQVIRWLMGRQQEGLRISRAVDLWHEMENQGREPLVDHSLTDHAPEIHAINNVTLDVLREGWIKAVINFDEEAAEQWVTQAFAEFSLETVCVEILQKGLSTIGSLWFEGNASVQQEHFASELVIRRLHALIAAAPKPFREKTILVGGPAGENHTFSMLLITLLLRFRGWQVFYLGANVPKDHLLETVENMQPDLVVMNAMRLSTAAALYDTAHLLNGMRVPLAFGGWIFNQVPGLADKIPAHFLGGSVPDGISAIESLLQGQQPSIKTVTNTGEFSESMALFQEHKDQIGKQVLETLREKLGRDINLANIQEANDFLAQDIMAALTLRELSLVNFDLDWVGRLISRHAIPGELLSDYLGKYLAAAREFLHDPGDPIIEWLTSIVQGKS